MNEVGEILRKYEEACARGEDTTGIRKKMDKVFREAARDMYQDEGFIEIDDNAVISLGETEDGLLEGAYVQAWVWVPGDDD